MKGDTGRTGRPGWRAVAVLGAVSLLGAVALSACSPDVAQATTTLRAVRAASILAPNGASTPAVDGDRVPRGSTVVTAPGGSAELETAGRSVLLGQDTAVRVVDGARQQLRRGLVFVDARKAPALDIDGGAARVQAPRDSLVRVERSALLLVAAYSKSATVRPTSRRTRVPVSALHQVQVPFGGLPGSVTALALRHDSWERHFALSLLNDDLDLDALAQGLDAPAPPVRASVVPAQLAAAAPLQQGEPASESLLAYLLARTSATHAVGRVYGEVRDLRGEGGSWGVVAALVQARVPAVGGALDALLLGPGAGPGSPVVGVPGPGAGAEPSQPGARPQPSSSGSRPRPSRSGQPSGSPSPTPSPSSGVVQRVVGTVVGLIPSPSPSPSLLPDGKAKKPKAQPSPLLSLGPVTVGGR